MIFGAAPLEFLQTRMSENKLTFHFIERPLKKGYYRKFVPSIRKKINRAYIQYKDKPLYVLCASAYTSYDLKICGFNAEKCFRWGYFPFVEQHCLDDLISLKNKSDKVELLHAGRLIKLKRSMDNVKAVKHLVKKGITNFRLTIIGEGDQKLKIEKFIKKNHLSEYINLLPFMPTEKLREYMQKASIYLFNSNYREGWGAVVNEAMNSACVVVGSHAAGSVPFLIENEKNGLIYQCGNIKKLSIILENLIINEEYRRKLAINSYETIIREWNSDSAVEKFLKLYNKIINKKEIKIENGNGVCDIAIPLRNNWIKKV